MPRSPEGPGLAFRTLLARPADRALRSLVTALPGRASRALRSLVTALPGGASRALRSLVTALPGGTGRTARPLATPLTLLHGDVDGDVHGFASCGCSGLRHQVMPLAKGGDGAA